VAVSIVEVRTKRVEENQRSSCLEKGDGGGGGNFPALEFVC